MPANLDNWLGLVLHLYVQDTLKAAGCSVIRAETAGGARRDGRSELQVLLNFLRPGDKQPSMSVLLVAQAGISPSLLFKWRRLPRW